MTKEELLARVEVLTAQNARFRAALEKYSTLDEQVSKCTDDDVNGHECQMAPESCGYCFPFADDARIAMRTALAETPAESLEAVRAKEYAMREALQFVLDCGHEGVDWCGVSTKASALAVCRRALEATPEQCASRLEAVRAEAGRERAVRELKAFMELVRGIASASLDIAQGSVLEGMAGVLKVRLEEIAKERP